MQDKLQAELRNYAGKAAARSQTCGFSDENWEGRGGISVKIRNYQQLISQGDQQSRKIVLDIAQAALRQLDAYDRLRSILHMDGDELVIGNKRWNLREKRHVYLCGAGKACNAMAQAVEDTLGDWLTDGVAVVKIQEPKDHFVRTRLRVGGHPLPNRAGLEACRELLELVDGAGAEDLFLCVMSGGSSALMGYPVEGITLEEEIETTDILLKSGAGIAEINAVRRHISRMNGGRLAQRIAARGAELIGFNISDSVSNPPTGDISVPWKDYSGTPMGPDKTTLADALACIDKYDLRQRLPRSVITYLTQCGPEGETPKQLPQNTYYQINTLPDGVRYAKKAAEDMGIPAVILTTFLEGEAKDAGTFMASIAREIQEYHQPVAPPCVVLSAGECVTTIADNSCIKGHGGPSQEMALSFALTAAKTQGACLMSIDSEGTDGTTCAAGGIADSQSLAAMEKTGADPYEALRGHACFEALDAAGCTVMTGNTGTNICDLNVMYVPAKSK